KRRLSFRRCAGGRLLPAESMLFATGVPQNKAAQPGPAQKREPDACAVRDALVLGWSCGMRTRWLS
ncbi:MAG: hypothetical protein EBX69_12440, partial [Betaproteobacteria bacterium]|nr:hypothetical protein [Betaproteobacteria bacterium]